MAMKLKEINAIKAKADTIPAGTHEHHKLMVSYHEEMAEYWDAKYGTIMNDDDKCSRENERHCNLMDKHYKLMMKAEVLR